MLEFSQRFDPQPFHLERSGGGTPLIASGWFTVAVMMRLLVDHFLPTHAMPSPGADELRWLLPVHEDDLLTLQVTVLETRRSRSKPDRGIVRTRAELFNQCDACVMSVLLTSFIATRPAPVQAQGSPHQ
jgi:acyl dehydratase